MSNVIYPKLNSGLALTAILTVAVLAAGCSSEPVTEENKPAESVVTETTTDSRYKLAQDKAPDQAFDASQIKELTPVYEPPSAKGNRSPYTVWGKQYEVLPSGVGYKTQGIASWYGKKFHGYATANGEVYDMYQLSAAHKSLPLPSYVLVTNLENQRQVLVRVNDRGPFHEDRVIDLSYAAAMRLGMLKNGTAKVKLETIDPITWNGGMDPSLNHLTPPVMVQVAAMSKVDSAQRIKSNLSKKTPQKIQVVSTEVKQRLLHKVQIGPVATRSELQTLIEMLVKEGFIRPIVLEVDNKS